MGLTKFLQRLRKTKRAARQAVNETDNSECPKLKSDGWGSVLLHCCGLSRNDEPGGCYDGCDDWEEWLTEFDHFLANMLNSVEESASLNLVDDDDDSDTVANDVNTEQRQSSPCLNNCLSNCYINNQPL